MALHFQVYNLNGKRVINQLENLKTQPKPSLFEFFVIERREQRPGFYGGLRSFQGRGNIFVQSAVRSFMTRMGIASGCPLIIVTLILKGLAEYRNYYTH